MQLSEEKIERMHEGRINQCFDLHTSTPTRADEEAKNLDHNAFRMGSITDVRSVFKRVSEDDRASVAARLLIIRWDFCEGQVPRQVQIHADGAVSEQESEGVWEDRVRCVLAKTLYDKLGERALKMKTAKQS